MGDKQFLLGEKGKIYKIRFALGGTHDMIDRASNQLFSERIGHKFCVLLHHQIEAK
jgi:hypothetical protein